MSRGKNFDAHEALTKAMHAFWSRGYEATSISDLVECMGIHRGSLYATFGDKRSLFLRALRHYGATHLDDWVAALTQAHGPRGAIIAAFDRVVATALEGGSRDGCLVINTALELSPHDEEI
ncbi:MAG: helix-turn-helix transcriptional regulator, partial [Proteobacteria bacterium]|nr:helix-turn-helix transcriptional regulator [Pseudomonadota bacterium]